MAYRNTDGSYGSVAKFFHWTVFALISCLLAVGFIMTDMENGPDKFKVYGWHKSVGIMVLFLVALRLAWKLHNVSPAMPNTLNALEKRAARTVHGLLYVLMFAMPMTGWLMSSAAGFSVSVFGWFTLPDLVSADKELREFFGSAHAVIAYLILLLAGAHVGAALLHHFYYRDNVLIRMLPFRRE